MARLALPPERRIRQRHAWLQEAARLGTVSLACQRLGVSREPFYQWQRRCPAAAGERTAPLDRSRRPQRMHRRVGKALRRRLLAPVSAIMEKSPIGMSEKSPTPLPRRLGHDDA